MTETNADTGPTDTGPTDTGPTDTGPTDTGPTDTGPTDTGPTDTGPTDTGPTDTGHPEVDAVLDSLDGLEQRPLVEHVAVFEAAHERLRGALSGGGQSGAGRTDDAGQG